VIMMAHLILMLKAINCSLNAAFNHDHPPKAESIIISTDFNSSSDKIIITDNDESDHA